MGGRGGGNQLLQTPLKKPQKKTEEVQEATASRADAKEISVDSAPATFLSGLDDILTIKVDQETAPKALFGVRFCFTPDCFDKSLWCIAARHRAVTHG